jgi:hypothetical protein
VSWEDEKQGLVMIGQERFEARAVAAEQGRDDAHAAMYLVKLQIKQPEVGT